MKNSSAQKMVRGTAILTLTGIIAKVLSAVYKIPFQNLVGNVGFYVYQQVYPIYGIGMTVALSGLPVFISHLVAQNDDPQLNRKVLSDIQWILLGLVLIVFVGLQLGDRTIAGWMGDWQLAPVIRAVSWMFLFTPFLATGRGYFQGIGNMYPTAYSQVVEQVVRVTVILSVAIWAANNHISPYIMGRNAMLSAPIAAAFALIIILVAKRKLVAPQNSVIVAERPRRIALLKQTLLEGGTVCLVAAVMVLLQLVDSFSVIKGLIGQGLPLQMAQNIKGAYDRGQTLVQFGLVLGTAAATSGLPLLTRFYQQTYQLSFVRGAKTLAHVSIFLAVAVSAGMAALMPQINLVLFASYDQDFVLGVYGISIVFATCLLVQNSILQSVGSFYPMMVAVLTGLATKVLLTKLMVRSIGVLGASVSTVLALIVMVLMANRLGRKWLKRIFKFPKMGRLLAISIGMMITVSIIANTLTMYLGTGRLTAVAILIITVPIGVVEFLGLSYRAKLLTKREWLTIPFMKTILKRMVKKNAVR
ncbi:polysaccharide biosynthesis protein [Lentilactobacillus senioris]|uniref:polysaccharide biosynthesis protein n=1 Tax=Lentilactobacillus senioris TaxID=931534 RepID=UPI00227DD7A9|nr:polysaccharide biosynthesis protein [Lentilactobacillus senioris]MCY9807575.1 polysaccharide biosynthesis protein [Lentilactobacillus senioris]